MAILGALSRGRGRQAQEGGSGHHAPAARLSICPACGGALAPRQRRCPSCGSRTVMGVPIRKAMVLTALGIVVGASGGAVVTGNWLSLLLPGPRTAAAVAGTAATAAPTPGATPSAAPTASVQPTPPPAPRAPAPVISALRQISQINDRLAESRRDLGRLLRSGSGTSDLAAGLRRIAVDASSAAQLVGRLRGWKGSTKLAADLEVFYSRLGRGASTTASLSNAAAYRDISRDALAVLDDLAGIASKTRTTLKSAATREAAAP